MFILYVILYLVWVIATILLQLLTYEPSLLATTQLIVSIVCAVAVAVFLVVVILKERT